MSYGNLDIKRVPFFICIGTPLNSFDCVGPMLGTKLKEMGFNVFGTMDNPVHAKNIGQHNHIFEGLSKGLLGEIYQVVGVDASINIPSSDAYRVFNAPLRPGAGIGRSLPHIGEACIHINSMMQYRAFKKLRLVLNVNSTRNKEYTKHIVNHIASKLSIRYGLSNIIRQDNKNIRTARAIERIVIHDMQLDDVAKELGISRACVHNYVYNKNTTNPTHRRSDELTKYIREVLKTHTTKYTPRNRLALLLQEER